MVRALVNRSDISERWRETEEKNESAQQRERVRES
jgi:hypothetical protein